jgi:hypothetical protein
VLNFRIKVVPITNHHFSLFTCRPMKSVFDCFRFDHLFTLSHLDRNWRLYLVQVDRLLILCNQTQSNQSNLLFWPKSNFASKVKRSIFEWFWSSSKGQKRGDKTTFLTYEIIFLMKHLNHSLSGQLDAMHHFVRTCSCADRCGLIMIMIITIIVHPSS